VIILRIPPLARGQDLSYNLSFPPLLIRPLRHLPRNSLLFRIMIEDSTPILRPGIRPLAVRSCRVMHFIEKFEELAVCYLRGVEGNLESFGIWNTSSLARISINSWGMRGVTYDQFFPSTQRDNLDYLYSHQYIQPLHHIIPFP
jgi:hypothetical protein